MTFIEIEMSTLNDFPKDEYAADAKPGDAPTKSAPYTFVQLGQHPYTNKLIGYVKGNLNKFTTEFPAEKYKEVNKIPRDYQQTCVNEILYGRTLNKWIIIMHKYPIDREFQVHRKLNKLRSIEKKVAANISLIAKEQNILDKKDDIESKFDDYNDWVESIPEEE